MLHFTWRAADLTRIPQLTTHLKLLDILRPKPEELYGRAKSINDRGLVTEIVFKSVVDHCGQTGDYS
jgi:hypothetical protein